jgi:hypothetical protein
LIARARLGDLSVRLWPLPLMEVHDAPPLVLLALAACGDAQTRMLIGAGIGAVGGALLGGTITPAPAGYPRGHQR